MCDDLCQFTVTYWQPWLNGEGLTRHWLRVMHLVVDGVPVSFGLAPERRDDQVIRRPMYQYESFIKAIFWKQSGWSRTPP